LVDELSVGRETALRVESKRKRRVLCHVLVH
jgi:hypothetical protein